jgi:hypothetical protein
MNAGVENARIIRTNLGFTNDHGFLDHWLHLDYGGSGQGFGGFILGYEDGRPTEGLAGDVIIWTLKTVGADDWNTLIGKPVRVFKEPWGRIYGIGNYLDDKWMWINSGAVGHGPLKELKAHLVAKGGAE